jgi:serine/threonine protein kinase
MIFLDRYEVIEGAEVFSGGQARIYQCLDSFEGIHVAVKTTDLTTALRARTHERDVKSLKRLSHDNIIELLDWGAENNTGFVVLPLMSANLDTYLANNKKISNFDKMSQIIVPLASALAYAHENKVFHRDLKPNNVLIGLAGNPVLTDFGAAKLYGPEESETTKVFWKSLSYTPDVPGTPSQHDVYSFGIMAVQVITGVMPKNLEEAIGLLETKSDRGIPVFSAGTKEILLKCLELDPKNRYSNAIEMYAKFVDRQKSREREVNEKSLFAWIRIDDNVREHLRSLQKDYENLSIALNDQFNSNSEFFAYPSKNDNDGTFRLNEFILVTDRLQLKLKQNSQKDGWYVSDGKVRDSQVLEIMRVNGFPLSKLGVKWGVHKHNPNPEKTVSGFNHVNQVISDWLQKGAPVDKGTIYVDQDVDSLTSKWLKTLDAREDVATVNFKPLRYKDAKIDGLRISLTLDEAKSQDLTEDAGSLELEGTFWKVSFNQPEIAEVVVQLGNELELLLGREPRGKIKPTGNLIPEVERGLASQLRRQRDAISSLVNRSSVNPKLGDYLANLSQINQDAPVSVMEWKDDNLDPSKKEAVSKALGTKDFLLVKGPPGTGKTSFIAEYVYQEIKRDENIQILLVSQTHVALDNALEKLVENGISECVRLGLPDDNRIAESSKKLLVDVQMREWMLKLRENSEGFIVGEASKAGVGIEEARALLTIREIKQLQLTIKSLEEENSAESTILSVDQEDVSQVTFTTGQILSNKKNELDRLVELLTRQLAGKLTIPADHESIDFSHIEGAILGTNQLSSQFMDIVDTQAKWLDRVGSSSQLTPVFLKTRRLLAGTCIGFMSMMEVRDLKFDICIIDEASRATIPQGLVSMVKAEKWIVVGDSNQLAPTEIELRNNEAKEILENYEIKIEDTEESIFSLIEDSLPISKQVTLDTQYRMRNEIGQMVSTLFYHNEIKSDGPRIDEAQAQFFRAIEWSDTSNMPSQSKSEFRDNLSFSNRAEIHAIQRSLNALKNAIDRNFIKTEKLPLKNNQKLKVLIIAPYSAQIIQARTILGNTKIYPFDIEFNSVDAVQGRESDIVFFSCVRSNDRQEVGFMGPKNWRRINVALSRARLQVNIIGDAYFWANTKSDLKDVLEYIREQDSPQFLIRDLATELDS